MLDAPAEVVVNVVEGVAASADVVVGVVALHPPWGRGRLPVNMRR